MPSATELTVSATAMPSCYAGPFALSWRSRPLTPIAVPIYGYICARPGKHQRGRADAARAGLQAGTLAAHECVLQLRHFAVDHLHSGWRRHFFSFRLVQRGRGQYWPGLAAGQFAGPGVCRHHGTAGICLPHRGRFIPLGVDPGRSGLGMGHCLVQPGGVDYRARCHQRGHVPVCTGRAEAAAGL